jgi:hypothetical protein
MGDERGWIGTAAATEGGALATWRADSEPGRLQPTALRNLFLPSA